MQTPRNTTKHTHAKILVSTLEYQVMWHFCAEVVDHWSSMYILPHASQKRVSDIITDVTLNTMNGVTLITPLTYIHNNY
jgi:hypothetical protein